MTGYDSKYTGMIAEQWQEFANNMVVDSMGEVVQELSYDGLNRLVSTPAGSVTSDGKGNITALDGAGGFGYASSREL